MLKAMGKSWIAPGVIFVLAALVYSLNLDRPPYPDELHHVLAAQSLFETGRPIIAEGEYWRGILYTWLVAVSYAVFGEGLASARLPSVMAVAMVVAILHVWVRREAGSRVAWFATVLFATSPYTVEIAQFCRFYSLQLLSFTGGSIAIFYAVHGVQDRWKKVLLVVLALALLALATSLQITSVIGILGLTGWLGGVLLQKGLSQVAPQNRLRVGTLVLLVVAIVLVAIMASFQDLAHFLVQRYRVAPLFAVDTANEFWYYHFRYHLFYPSLWPVVVILAMFAIAQCARLGWFSAVVFAIAFVLTSLAAQKATRYFSYAQPFLSILWGLGIVNVLPVISQHIKKCSSVLAGSIGLPTTQTVLVGQLLGIFLAVTVAIANPFWLRSATLIANVALPSEIPMTDWRAARATLAPWIESAEIMITTEELGAIYFLGRSDVRFSPSKFGELRPDQQFEFGIDVRTGRPIISKPQTVDLLMRCFSKGFIVGPAEDWGSPILIDADVQDVIRAQGQLIEVPKKSHLFAWGWDRPTEAARPAACESLPRSLGNKPSN